MALDLYEASAAVKKLFTLASEILGRDMQKTLAESSEEELKKTDTAQGAVTLANLAAATFLSERGITAAMTAGHSLGEYAALCTAGVLSVEACFSLVGARGRAMAANTSAPEGSGMMAVLGLDGEEVERLIAAWREDGLTELHAANFNAKRQTVVSGTAAALIEGERRFKEAGARRVLPLRVAGPFHSPLMQDASAAFAAFVQEQDFLDPKIPVFSNVTGCRIVSGAEARALAVRQITEPVRWTAVEAALAALAPDAVFEAGPGKVLQGLWVDTGTPPPCRPAGKASDLSEPSG
jgi:[acyl-carrier-protein] S-malonyltransferase